jgi:hypothetical protein
MESQKDRPRLVICVENAGCDDLVLRKIYQVIPDESAARSGYIRVIDESGEDYVYPEHYFFAIELPEDVEKVLFAATP